MPTPGRSPIRIASGLRAICCALGAGAALALAAPAALAQDGPPPQAEEAPASIEATYALGLKAQRERRYSDAINLLERVVLEDPRHAGAWLDLAITYYETGDFDTAAQLFDHVQRDFSPGPAVAGVVDRYRAQIAQRRAQAERSAARAWRAEAGLGVGAGRNINSAPVAGSVILTLASQAIELPLAENQRPANGPFLQSNLLVTWAPAQGPRTWEAVAHLETRVFPGLNQWNMVSALLGASRIWALQSPWESAVALALLGQHVELGGKGLQDSLLANARYRMKLGPCVGSVGMDLDRRTHPVDTILNSTASLAAAGLECPTGPLAPEVGAWLPSEVRLDLRGGRDRPDADRAGGAQDRLELGMLATHRVGGARIEYSVQLGRYRDREGYSPLLAGGAARSSTRRQLALAYVRPLSPTTEAYAQAQVLRQSSNLSLFDVHMSSAQAGMRWKF